MGTNRSEEDFFVPGDEVVVNKEGLENRPVMVVKAPERTTLINKGGTSSFKGLKCFWFDKQGRYCEATFNTKDLEYFS